MTHLSSIALVRAYAGILRDHRPSKQCHTKANHVMQVADTVIDSWGENVGTKGLEKILANQTQFMHEVQMIPTAYAMTSVALRVLEDMLEKKKPSNGQPILTGKRRVMINQLIEAVLDLHLFFDRGNVTWRFFDVADIAAQVWLRIVDNFNACKLYAEQDRSEIIRDIMEIKSAPGFRAWAEGL